MAHVTICDNCGKTMDEGDDSTYEKMFYVVTPPAIGHFGSPTTEMQFCSAQCIAKYFMGVAGMHMQPEVKSSCDID